MIGVVAKSSRFFVSGGLMRTIATESAKVLSHLTKTPAPAPSQDPKLISALNEIQRGSNFWGAQLIRELTETEMRFVDAIEYSDSDKTTSEMPLEGKP
jgi:hypothetical protein